MNFFKLNSRRAKKRGEKNKKKRKERHGGKREAPSV